MQIAKQHPDPVLLHAFLHDLANQVTAILLQHEMLRSPAARTGEVEEQVNHMYECMQHTCGLISSFQDYLSDK